MKASELKRMYEFKNPDGKFFTRDTMSFFADTMSNFGVSSYDEDHWHLYRKSQPRKPAIISVQVGYLIKRLLPLTLYHALLLRRRHHPITIRASL